ncbi:hypothetical protein PMIN01_09305 [Paraphaeosphaeria minitans]|uniref:Uncharacterized protein n=1 Tax=Paraphaeosphaeria minitans TaxID=565426 RepID=A0A9P6GBE7_9PLEO|nr:hypothetical protein PMIN01_09305 [Paraphaeosphaeria minitans]
MAKAPNELLITTATVTPTLILGIPVIIGAIVLENTYVPGIVLGLKSIDAGSSGPKTLTFHLQTNLDDTVRASTIYILTRTKSSSLPLYHPSAHESARTYRGVRRAKYADPGDIYSDEEVGRYDNHVRGTGVSLARTQSGWTMQASSGHVTVKTMV